MNIQAGQTIKITVAGYGEVEIFNRNDKSLIVTWQKNRRTETGSIQIENGQAVGVVNLTANLLSAISAAL